MPEATMAMVAVIPPKIEPGQTLGIVAPAGPIAVERLRRGIDRLGDVFRIRVADSLAAPRSPGVPSYLAASDEVRAAELSSMIADPDVRAIVLARGGYGIMRILRRLDPDVLRRDPKPIVGFSDATALLAWAYAAGVRGIHGPMIGQLGDLDAADTARLIAMLTDPRPLGVRPWRLECHGSGIYRGPLVAANVTMWSMLVGTPWPVPARGALAVIEDVGEKPYRLDRHLTHLELAGELGQVAAMIVGDLTRCDDAQPTAEHSEPSATAAAVVLDRLRVAGVAVATGAPIGHDNRNEALPFGGQAVLDLDAGTVEVLDAAVA